MKKKKVTKKICTLMLASTLLTGTLPVSAIANGDAEIIQDSIGLELDDQHLSAQEQFELDEYNYLMSIVDYEHQNKYSPQNPENASLNSTSASLPSSIDLSTSKYFPPIGDQGNLGSCLYFATVYYQFTYEANKLNNIASDGTDTIYSPSWPFYFLTSSELTSKSTLDVMNFLSSYGALTLDNDPYDSENKYNSSYVLPSDLNLMREALKTKVSSHHSNYIASYDENDTTAPVITNPNDSDLVAIKQLLYLGKVLTVISDYQFISRGIEGKSVHIRCSDNNGAECHVMTVVGYDDNICCDVNGDGEIEDGERGAFKIANSYGADATYDGYEWVLYDALNYNTSISGDWEDTYVTTRCPAFAVGSLTNENLFVHMNVKNYATDFIAEIEFEDVYPFDVDCFLSKTSNGVTYTSNYLSSGSNAVPESYKLVSDYGFSTTNFANDVNATWKVTLDGNQKTAQSIKLTDERGKVIKTMTGRNGVYSTTTNLVKGDVTYDNTLTSDDATQITQHITGHDIFSNLQLYLADYNGDGTINSMDAIQLQQAIS